MHSCTLIQNDCNYLVLYFQVFYRLHVCVLKCIVKRTAEAPLEMMKNYLEESLETPFAMCEEKKWKSGK